MGWKLLKVPFKPSAIILSSPTNSARSIDRVKQTSPLVNMEKNPSGSFSEPGSGKHSGPSKEYQFQGGDLKRVKPCLILQAAGVTDVSQRPLASDILIAVVGITGAGKSTFIDKLVDEEVGVGHDLTSRECLVSLTVLSFYSHHSIDTSEIGLYSLLYKANGISRRVILIDTPGFDDTNRSDTDILQEISYVLSKTYQSGLKLAGIIYLHRITDVRMSGSSLKNLNMFQKLCGENFYDHVVLATTMWGKLGGDVHSVEEGLRREKELIDNKKWWGLMHRRGSQVFRCDDSEESSMKILSYIVELGSTAVLDIQREMVDEKKTLANTSAGQEVQKELQQQQRKHEKEKAELHRAREQALQEKDQELAQELMEERREHHKKLSAIEKDRLELTRNLHRMTLEQETRFTKMLEQLQEQHEREKREDQERREAERKEDKRQREQERRRIERLQEQYEKEKREDQERREAERKEDKRQREQERRRIERLQEQYEKEKREDQTRREEEKKQDRRQREQETKRIEKERRIYENKLEQARKRSEEQNKAEMKAAEQERKRVEWERKQERDAMEQQHQGAMRAVTNQFEKDRAERRERDEKSAADQRRRDLERDAEVTRLREEVREAHSTSSNVLTRRTPSPVDSLVDTLELHAERLPRRASFMYAERWPSGSLAVAAILANNTSWEVNHPDYDEDWKLREYAEEREAGLREAGEWSESD